MRKLDMLRPRIRFVLRKLMYITLIVWTDVRYKLSYYKCSMRKLDMLRPRIRFVLRKLMYITLIGRSKKIVLPLLLVSWCVLLWHTSTWLVTITADFLLPPAPPDHLSHFQRNRNLAHYMDNIQVLIEPSTSPCPTLAEVPVIIMVASSPDNFESRLAVRNTWARFQPTFFVLGLQEGNLDDHLLVEVYFEAKQYSDLVVFDFTDHYQNLTLKTALMIHWTIEHCPQAQFMLKTDDDVLINPWTLKEVMKEHEDVKLVGYRKNNTKVHRDAYLKFYMPRWMFNEDTLHQYLCGAAYIISGEYLKRILKAAYHVPLVNLEDVYFTYVVANRKLGLTLNHDRRLTPYRPLFGFSCAYFSLAASHGYTPEQMLDTWSKIESIAYNNRSCSFYRYFFDSDLLMY